MTTYTPPASAPALSVLGVTKSQARRAINYLQARNLLAFYNPRDRDLCAFEFKHGRDWTYAVLKKALAEDRK